MLKAENISIGYGGKPLVEGISFEAVPGETVLLCGANGSGKSTLLRTFAGLVPPLSGRVEKQGCAFVPTRIPKLKGFTLKEFLLLSNYRFKGRDSELEKDVLEAAERLSLQGILDKDLSTLSDGEFQKACIASVLPSGCDTILLDEPTAFLDVGNRVDVLSALQELCREEGTCVIFSSHDIAEASKLASRVIGITPGKEFVCSGCGREDIRGAIAKILDYFT